MNNQPAIIQTESKILVGKKLEMSHSNDLTKYLWQSFMPRKKEILKRTSENLFSMQVYPATYDLNKFDPDAKFTKWAAVEVKELEDIPPGMEVHLLQGGLYAVFNYKGERAGAGEFFRCIFEEWLPGSGYVLDQREHFEVLGEKYNKDSDTSEEGVWIPIR